MNKVETANQEYERLKSLFLSGDANKLNLVDELLKKASFLKVELDELEEDIRKNGTIQISNRGNVRGNPSYKIYLQSLSVYQGIIKTLNAILGNEIEERDDVFDEFMKKAQT